MKIQRQRRLIIGMTGSTGAIFGVRFLEALKQADIETHLIISKWAQRTIEHETNYTIEQVRALASVVHSQGDMGATISSGSFLTEGMVVIPCSVRTLAGIANGYGEHLVHRAADVVLKERRQLGAGGARDAALRGAPRKHAQARAHGRGDAAADAGLLQSSADRSTTWSTTSSAACSISSRYRRPSPSAGTAICTLPPRSRPSAGRRRKRRRDVCRLYCNDRRPRWHGDDGSVVGRAERTSWSHRSIVAFAVRHLFLPRSCQCRRKDIFKGKEINLYVGSRARRPL